MLNPHAKSYLRQTLKLCYAINEIVGKHRYNEIIMKVDQKRHGISVWQMNATIAGTITINNRKKSQVTTWMRTKINYALLQSVTFYLRRFDIVTRRNKEHADIELEKYLYLSNKKNI